MIAVAIFVISWLLLLVGPVFSWLKVLVLVLIVVLVLVWVLIVLLLGDILEVVVVVEVAVSPAVTLPHPKKGLYLFCCFCGDVNFFVSLFMVTIFAILDLIFFKS